MKLQKSFTKAKYVAVKFHYKDMVFCTKILLSRTFEITSLSACINKMRFYEILFQKLWAFFTLKLLIFYASLQTFFHLCTTVLCSLKSVRIFQNLRVLLLGKMHFIENSIYHNRILSRSLQGEKNFCYDRIITMVIF